MEVFHRFTDLVEPVSIDEAFLDVTGSARAMGTGEQIGRKLVGGLFGKVAGGMAGSLARGATGAVFSFATTYAIGEVARRYYAGGRVMSAELLKRTFSEMLSQGKAMQAQYLPQIEQQVRTLDVSRIVQMVRNN